MRRVIPIHWETYLICSGDYRNNCTWDRRSLYIHNSVDNSSALFVYHCREEFFIENFLMKNLLIKNFLRKFFPVPPMYNAKYYYQHRLNRSHTAVIPTSAQL